MTKHFCRDGFFPISTCVTYIMTNWLEYDHPISIFSLNFLKNFYLLIDYTIELNFI